MPVDVRKDKGTGDIFRVLARALAGLFEDEV